MCYITKQDVCFRALKLGVQFSAYMTAGKAFFPISVDGETLGPPSLDLASLAVSSVYAALGATVTDMVAICAYPIFERRAVCYGGAKFLVNWLAGSAIFSASILSRGLTLPSFWRIADACFVSSILFECLNHCIESCQQASRIMAFQNFLESAARDSRNSSQRNSAPENAPSEVGPLPLSERNFLIFKSGALGSADSAVDPKVAVIHSSANQYTAAGSLALSIKEDSVSRNSAADSEVAAINSSINQSPEESVTWV